MRFGVPLRVQPAAVAVARVKRSIWRPLVTWRWAGVMVSSAAVQGWVGVGAIRGVTAAARVEGDFAAGDAAWGCFAAFATEDRGAPQALRAAVRASVAAAATPRGTGRIADMTVGSH
jgi:hypothetical protein